VSETYSGAQLVISMHRKNNGKKYFINNKIDVN